MNRSIGFALWAYMLAGTTAQAALPEGSALIEAVRAEDPARVSALLAAGAKANTADIRGVTPLGVAAMVGNDGLIKVLLKSGARVDAAMAQGETPLMLAARIGCVSCLEQLLKSGAHVNAIEPLRGTNALMWAAANHNPQAVAILLSHGASVGIRSAAAPTGHTPYLADTAQDRIEAFRLGVGQAGKSIAVSLDKDVTDDSIGLAADVIAAARPGDKANAADAPKPRAVAPSPPKLQGGGLTALVFAAREGDLESARTLLKAGADVNQTTFYGWTALLTAIQNRRYVFASMLLEVGANPNLANEGGWTPLYIATDNRNIEGGDYPTRRPDLDHLEMIDKLLAKGADPNIRMKSSTETRTVFTHQWLHENGATAYLRAAQSGDLVLMQRLLEAGADPTLVSDQGVTPLMVASGIGWVEGVTFEWSPGETLATVKFLIKQGADANARDHVDGRTALMGAAHKGRSDVVQLLIDHGARLDTRDVGSRDSIHKLAGLTWQAIDYADGLVRVGVQSSVAHPETAALLRKLMLKAGLPVPPEGRTLDSVCITALCRPE
jgi:uncharacterized protein